MNFEYATIYMVKMRQISRYVVRSYDNIFNKIGSDKKKQVYYCIQYKPYSICWHFRGISHSWYTCFLCLFIQVFTFLIYFAWCENYTSSSTMAKKETNKRATERMSITIGVEHHQHPTSSLYAFGDVMWFGLVKTFCGGIHFASMLILTSIR